MHVHIVVALVLGCLVQIIPKDLTPLFLNLTLITRHFVYLFSRFINEINYCSEILIKRQCFKCNAKSPYGAGTLTLTCCDNSSPN